MEGCIAFHLVVLIIQRVQWKVWSVVSFRHVASILAFLVKIEHLPNAPLLIGIKGCFRSKLMPTHLRKTFTKDDIAPLSALLQMFRSRTAEIVLDLREHGKKLPCNTNESVLCKPELMVTHPLLAFHGDVSDEMIVVTTKIHGLQRI
jgi:hypothetical protein